MVYHILLVEDDPQITEVITDYFMGCQKATEWSYEVDSAMTGTKGMELLREKEYDLVLLDVMLPGMNGFSVLRQLRRTKDVPVIIITAKVREEDRLLGYELGCDDYVCKPFSLAELYAKANALIKRSKGKVINEELICGAISLHRRTLEVKVNGRPIELTPKELELLVTFLERKNWIFTRDMLLDRIWGPEYEGSDRTVDNHVKKLRKSLKEAGGQIKTIYSKGYKLSES